MHLLTLLLELPVRFCPQANQVSLTLVGSQLETQPFSRAPSSLPGPTGLGMVAQEGRGGPRLFIASRRCRSTGGDSPAEHEDGAGRGVMRQREGLLETELLAAAVEAV